MVFRRDIEPSCSYCRHGSSLAEGLVICERKGIVSEAFHCRRFRYDPLRRVPPRPAEPDFSKYDDRDFSL